MIKFKHLLFASILGFTTLAMNGCDAIYWDESASLAKVQAQGEIRVLTLKNPMVYSTDKTGHKFGIDHDLLENFAHHYGLKLKFTPVANEQEMRQALANGIADIGAGRLPSQAHNSGFLIGPSYEESFLGLFCHNKIQVDHISDLNQKKVAILSKDNFAGLTERLLQIAPQTQIEVTSSASTKILFESVARKNFDCVITENLEGEFFARYYRHVDKVTALTEKYSLSWIVHPGQQDLHRLLQAWFQKASRNDEIMRIHDRYKLYLSELDTHDVLHFMKRSRRTLPDFESEFRKAAQEHRLPWQLVAAVAYQESQWNNEAVSHTGVRGLMQLTTETAVHLGVEDRTDPLQSIWGGAKYLRYLLNRTPKYINFKDRLSLALAAYNMGYGHLQDAQKLAAQKGKNPYSWRHLREVIPLLEDPSHFTLLEYGFARGNETVSFVDRVTGFYNLMVATQH